MIVASLLAFAYPALSSAKMASKRAICASNLHQIGVATEAYIGDYDDQYPNGINAIEKVHPSFHSLGRDKDVDPNPFPNIPDQLDPYLRARGVLRCPLDVGRSFNEDPAAEPSLFLFNDGSSYLFADLLQGQNSSTWTDPTAQAYASDASGEWHVSPNPSYFQLRINSLYYDWHVSFTEWARGLPDYKP